MDEARLSASMIRHILDGIAENTEAETAMNIAFLGGRLTGEDHLYQFLDLQDPYPLFLEKAVQLGASTWFPEWKIHEANPSTGIIRLEFGGIGGCRGRYHRKPAVYCEFMTGYLTGILETYTMGHAQYKMHCQKKNCPKGKPCDEVCWCDIQMTDEAGLHLREEPTPGDLDKVIHQLMQADVL